VQIIVAPKQRAWRPWSASSTCYGVMRGGWGRACLAAAIAMQLAACREGPTREQVVLRLGARDFGATDPLPHAATVRIGEVVRSVPFAREAMLSPIVPSSPARGGRFRAVVLVPKTAVGLPSSAFAVSVVAGLGGLEAGMDPGAASAFSATAVRLDRGWQLHANPRAPERAKVLVHLPDVAEGASSLLQLQAVPPMPRRLTSRSFDVPWGASLGLAYGLAGAARVAPDARVCFRATLDCAWRWTRELVSDCVRAGDAVTRGWSAVERRIGWGGGQCRLTMTVDHEGLDAGDPTWAEPIVRTRVPDDATVAPNVILVSLDTLRADHLSGYGYPRQTSPAFDALMMRRGTTFTDASTTYPLTNWAHLSIFTGLYPAALPANGVMPATAAIPMLTELLRDAGYATVAFTEDALVSREYGFGFGFDELTELHPEPQDRARLVFARGSEVLRASRDRRFFLFLHTYKVHTPYTPSPRHRTLFRGATPSGPAFALVPKRFQSDRDAYDQSIAELDEVLAAFLRTLDESGLADRTLLVVLSDHGEAFGEHGFPGHGASPHQEALHVPLVFRGPGLPAGREITTPVSVVDVAPTILELLKLPIPPSIQGRSLRGALAGEALAARPLFFEWWGGWNRGVRAGTVKLMRRDHGVIVHDLAKDPLEVAPSSDPAEAAPSELVTALDDYEADGGRRRAQLQVPAAPASVAPEVGRALRALGYIE